MDGAQQLQYQPTGQWNMSKCLNKISRLSGWPTLQNLNMFLHVTLKEGGYYSLEYRDQEIEEPKNSF